MPALLQNRTKLYKPYKATCCKALRLYGFLAVYGFIPLPAILPAAYT